MINQTRAIRSAGFDIPNGETKAKDAPAGDVHHELERIEDASVRLLDTASLLIERLCHVAQARSPVDEGDGDKVAESLPRTPMGSAMRSIRNRLNDIDSDLRDALVRLEI